MFRRRDFDLMGRPVYGRSYGRFEHNKLLHPQFMDAVLRSSPCVVGIVSHGAAPDEFWNNNEDGAFTGSGTIIECNQNAGDDGKFSATILTTASLFYRPNGVQPSDVDVHLPSREICKGKVLACDFHYNLAVVNVQLDAAVQPPKPRDLDDTTTNDSHSNSFKIQPGDYVAALMRSYPFEFDVDVCRCSVSHPIYDYSELISFSTEDSKFEYNCGGGPVINCHGQVIGILALGKTFIPSNLVSRWWNSYKNCKEFRRPWLGLIVTNLRSANFGFLEQFLRTFPTASSGIVVKKVVENSPAHRSGLLKKDVIVQCNGAAVGSALDFFEKIWGRVGESVELCVLRVAGRVVNVVTVTVGEPTPNNFHIWPIPIWRRMSVLDSEMSELRDSDSESSSDSE